MYRRFYDQWPLQSSTRLSSSFSLYLCAFLSPVQIFLFIDHANAITIIIKLQQDKWHDNVPFTVVGLIGILASTITSWPVTILAITTTFERETRELFLLILISFCLLVVSLSYTSHAFTSRLFPILLSWSLLLCLQRKRPPVCACRSFYLFPDPNPSILVKSSQPLA